MKDSISVLEFIRKHSRATIKAAAKSKELIWLIDDQKIG